MCLWDMYLSSFLSLPPSLSLPPLPSPPLPSPPSPPSLPLSLPSLPSLPPSLPPSLLPSLFFPLSLPPSLPPSGVPLNQRHILPGGGGRSDGHMDLPLPVQSAGKATAAATGHHSLNQPRPCQAPRPASLGHSHELCPLVVVVLRFSDAE